jgi:hypothetical protein
VFVRKPTDGQLAIGALIAFALWIFVALPLYYGPRDDPAAYKCSTKENENYSFWEKARCDPVAYFTAWLVGFTGVLSISTIGLWWVTWQGSKQQSGDMRAALAHAEKALGTAERAFVFLDGFNIELTTALDSDAPDYEWLPQRYRQDPGLYITRFAAQPRWKNGGNTPTEQLTIRVNWIGPTGPIGPEYPYRMQPRPFLLAPKAVEPSDYIDMPGAQALVDWSSNPVGDSPIIFIWGRADYRDVFRRPHFIEWCYQLRVSRPIRQERMSAAFIQWGDYNRTDNDDQG